MDLKECPECFHDFSSNIEFVKKTNCCPKCGANIKNNKGVGKSYNFIIIGIFVLIISIVGFFLWTQSAS